MRKWSVTICILVCAALLTRVHRSRADDATTAPAYDWKSLDAVIGSRGQLHDDVYTFTLPRTDLDVSVESMEVPAAAGVCSQFNFFRCPCGKIRVIGQFCCADYEVNDVIDAIRPGAMIHVGGVGAMFISDRPHLSLIRFQGEGDATALAKLLKSGLGWLGDARNPPATRPAQ